MKSSFYIKIIRNVVKSGRKEPVVFERPTNRDHLHVPNVGTC